jgi:uncharacterized protein
LIFIGHYWEEMENKYDNKERFYRYLLAINHLLRFEIKVEETDLMVMAEKNIKKEIKKEVEKQRAIIKNYIKEHPSFYYSFKPVSCDSQQEIIKIMSNASFLTQTGPMASVAGAIAETTGKKFLKDSPQLLIENGGDIFAKINTSFKVGIFAGNSPLSMKLGLKLPAAEFPVGIASSSGTVGHSFSYGNADAVTVISASAALSDGAATYLGNSVREKIDKNLIMKEIEKFPFIKGVLIIKDEEVFIWGAVETVLL